MNFAHRLELWGDTHHPKWLDIIRIVLGIFLCYKGFEFLNNMGSLLDVMTNRLSFNAFAIILLSHAIVFAHILGGFLLALGLLTRFACLIQIPILIGAVFLVNAREGMNVSNNELILSGIVLILLVVFVIKGSGAISADEYFRNYYKAGYESGHTKKFLE